ncbi:chromatin assembly factor 1 subunit FAS1 isoform X2 [Humulus lupulus]|uniref:chromatin assembly factor 1 subunit FAS1 isoform X2 n=1 Tax=Humulus lupulus TaxID=3486 RepID=UPI002B404846|nr:chromatin assembly factor 1 subunit FAS1 isoform X2 [Humulus lupulus]
MEVVVGGNDSSNVQKMDGQDRPKKTQKRKRVILATEKLGKEEREAKVEALRKEIDGLFSYYKEVMGQGQIAGLDPNLCRNGANAVVASLMEERDLPLSKLVDEIYAQAKNLNDTVSEGLTVATVKSTVLFVGQRMMYGVPNVDADVLEDQSDSCLWCWETRDLKLMPKSVRGVLTIRRTCRKRIHERITAVSEMIMALQKPEEDQNYKTELMKASEKLYKARNEAEIRLLVNGLMEKSDADLAGKDAKREEKLLVKQLEREKREAEKEKKRLEKELLKEKLQSEKEQKRLQEEAEKDEKRREREELEMKKQLRKQQEEAEKDQRRREREEAELKKQLSIQKQASIMERFLKKSKTSPLQAEKSSPKISTTVVTLSERSEKVPEAVTQLMDCTLSLREDVNIADICKLHFSSWRRIGHSIRSNRNQHWSLRQKPKADLVKELKLTTPTRPLIVVLDESNDEKLESGCGECVSDDRSCQPNATCSLSDVKKFIRRKQLLQFDKSHRPAFYGIWPSRSRVVGPRHPLTKDPDLDYDIDSDEEWEEEDPGESLSDCEKDDDAESLEGCSKNEDEDESEDEFFVPDGYLSDNEGVQVDRMEIDESKSSPGLESEEFRALLRQQKYVSNLTDHALRKNQPLIILNLMHEKTSMLTAEDLTGTPRMEQMCLQVLSLRLFPGGSPVEISLDNAEENEQEASPSSGKGRTTPTSTVVALSDSDMRTVVSTIQSCSQGIHKLVELLQMKFPSHSKAHLRNKVREISDFVDNHWQVKKEVLNKLGLSPEKGTRRTKSIATFFSKRCLPPAGKGVNPSETSPQPSLKTNFAVEEGQQSCT